MTWTSNRARVQAALTEALKAGVTAGGHVYANAVKRQLRGGYTSGDFVTGLTLSSVTVTEPEIIPDGVQVRVGTDLMYNLFWELGHVNLFTRQYERVEVWRPALLQHTEAIRSAIFAAASARIQGMVAPTTGTARLTRAGGQT